MVIQQEQAVIYKEHLPVNEGWPVLLHRLFYNLVNDTLKFSKAAVRPLIQIVPEKLKTPHISTEALQGLEYLQITIKDNVIGFDQNQADKIFKTFSRRIQKINMRELDLVWRSVKRL